MQVKDQKVCQGCPLFQDGSQEYFPIRPAGSKKVVVLVGEPDDVLSTANSLKRYVTLAGLTGEDIEVTSALRCRCVLPKPVSSVQWKAGKLGDFERGLRFCHNVHYPASYYMGDFQPRLIVTLGDIALQAATGQRSAYEWRGWLLPYLSKSDSWLNEIWTPSANQVSVLSMVTFADVYGMPTLNFAMRSDWQKVGKILAGKWPQKFPGYVTVPPDIWPKLSAFDTEFDGEGRLERYSLYAGGARPWVVEAHDVRFLELPGDCTVIMHNLEADIAHLKRFLRGGSIKAEDSMLAHSVLYSDLPHDLDFLGSLYARTNRWKHLFRRAPLPYSAGDALGTWDVWFNGLLPEFRGDPQSAWVYRNCVFPLASIIMEAEIEGIRTSQPRVSEALAEVSSKKYEVGLEAQAYCGYPINIGSSDQVSRWLYEVEGIGLKKKGRKKNDRA